MLVLTRRINEKIVITFGDIQVNLIVLSTNNRTQTKIGIDAPRDINIYREEIFKRVQKEKNLEENNIQEKAEE